MGFNSYNRLYWIRDVLWLADGKASLDPLRSVQLGPAAPNHRRTCFGWDPRHQTTGARALVGTHGTKPQGHQNTGARALVWTHGTKPQGHQTTDACTSGWGPRHLPQRHQTTDARASVGAHGTKPQTHVLWLDLPVLGAIFFRIQSVGYIVFDF